MSDTTSTAPVYDPCASYGKLRQAYEALLSGESIKRVRFRNGEDERDTEFTQANLSDLRQAMLQAKEDCARSMNGRGTRFAIQGSAGGFYGVNGPCFPGGRRIY